MKPVSYAQLMARLHPDTHGRAVGDRDNHAQRRLDPVQAEADRLRGSARWKWVRRAKLRRDPLCETCLAAGETRAACDVDHVVPVVELLRRGTPNAVFDPTAIQSICRSCHNVKSSRERMERKARAAAATTSEAAKWQQYVRGPGRALIATQSEDGDQASRGRRDARKGGGGVDLRQREPVRRAGGSVSFRTGFPEIRAAPRTPDAPKEPL